VGTTHVRSRASAWDAVVVPVGSAGRRGHVDHKLCRLLKSAVAERGPTTTAFFLAPTVDDCLSPRRDARGSVFCYAVMNGVHSDIIWQAYNNPLLGGISWMNVVHSYSTDKATF
jgi:hypothetical protein